MQRTLKRESKELEAVGKEAIVERNQAMDNKDPYEPHETHLFDVSAGKTSPRGKPQSTFTKTEE